MGPLNGHDDRFLLKKNATLGLLKTPRHSRKTAPLKRSMFFSRFSVRRGNLIRLYGTTPDSRLFKKPANLSSALQTSMAQVSTGIKPQPKGGMQAGPTQEFDVSQSIRIGQLLIENRVLSEQQVFEIVEAQKRLHIPFGVLAERMFDVTIESIESAWIEQYHRFTGTIDLNDRTIDTQALRHISRRQAWQFEVLPLGFEPTGELLLAASHERLARAVTFATNRIDHAVFFRVAESNQLRSFLRDHYPMPEVSQHILDRARDLTAPASQSVGHPDDDAMIDADVDRFLESV